MRRPAGRVPCAGRCRGSGEEGAARRAHGASSGARARGEAPGAPRLGEDRRPARAAPYLLPPQPGPRAGGRRARGCCRRAARGPGPWRLRERPEPARMRLESAAAAASPRSGTLCRSQRRRPRPTSAARAASLRPSRLRSRAAPPPRTTRPSSPHDPPHPLPGVRSAPVPRPSLPFPHPRLSALTQCPQRGAKWRRAARRPSWGSSPGAFAAHGAHGLEMLSLLKKG